MLLKVLFNVLLSNGPENGRDQLIEAGGSAGSAIFALMGVWNPINTGFNEESSSCAPAPDTVPGSSRATQAPADNKRVVDWFTGGFRVVRAGFEVLFACAAKEQLPSRLSY